MSKIKRLEERIKNLPAPPDLVDDTWSQIFAKMTEQERMDVAGFIVAIEKAGWPLDAFDFEEQLKYPLSGLVSLAEHDAALKAWRLYGEIKAEKASKE
jgi:hypothetical protein